MNCKYFNPAKSVFWACVLLLGCMLISSVVLGQTQTPAKSQPAQTAFDTPQAAGAAFIDAAARYDVAALEAMLGPESKDLFESGDPIRDKNNAEKFSKLAAEKNTVELAKDKKTAMLSVGPLDWPLPIPIVKRGKKWYFDGKQGREEILARRIGANELDAITICRGFVDAQVQYAELATKYTGVAQYAQKIISSPGKHDGLYWVKEDGTGGGPISEAIAKVIAEGYSIEQGSPRPYHGYYFKVLKGAGPDAPGGEIDYVINGIMIGGFALAAAPVDYGVSGINTFLVSYEGVVYQKDLGPDTLKIFNQMDRYNPDKTWAATMDHWPNDPVADLGRDEN